MDWKLNSHSPSLDAEEEKEVRLFDELIKLPREVRHRLLEAVKTYEIVEAYAKVSN